MLFFEITAVIVIAYLFGSIPTAFIIASRIKGVDIRTVGDGNMGATNTFREIGPNYGTAVAVIDFSKGVLPVLLAHLLGFSLGWQFTVGIAAILGHDFPVFAGFKGGQGMATSLGTMLILFPGPTLIGLLLYSSTILFLKINNLSLGLAGASIAGILAYYHHWSLLVYCVAVLLCIPLKQFIDSPRRKAIKMAEGEKLDTRHEA